MSLWSRLRGKETRDISTIDDFIQALQQSFYSGAGAGFYETWQGDKATAKAVGEQFASLASGGYRSNAVVFACMELRRSVFSSPWFRFQRLRDGKPTDMFSTSSLGILQRPWPGGTTQNLLSRTINDGDVAGNAFWVRDAGELVRLRPDWVEIAIEPRIINGGMVGHRKLGIVYYEGGKHSGSDGVIFLEGEYAHYMPIPDPLFPWRGMSWLTPVIREMVNDRLMSDHKSLFFENGATPNIIVKHAQGASPDQVEAFADRMEERNAGTSNAFKTLHLYPGADATVAGANMVQVDFKQLQGAGETRIAAAAGTPPVLVGLSEGLQGSSLNEGNFAAARRRFADGTMHNLWGEVAGSMQVLVPPPGTDARLAIDPDVPFTREDVGDAATIAQTKAATIKSLIDSGYEPESVVKAVEADDLRLLEHTGLFSVQLQKPGADQPAPPNTAPEGVSA